MLKRVKFKNTKGYCEYSHCRYWNKCSLKMTPEKRARMAADGEEPEILEHCVYLDYTFENKVEE